MHGGPNQNREWRERNRFREFADILITYFCGTNSLKIEWLQTSHIYYLTVLVGHQLGIVQGGALGSASLTDTVKVLASAVPAEDFQDYPRGS